MSSNNDDEIKQAASGDSRSWHSRNTSSDELAPARVPMSAPAPSQSRNYEDRMRAKLREADEHQAANRARAGLPSSDASVASSHATTVASMASASTDAADSAPHASVRADRFWRKAGSSADTFSPVAASTSATAPPTQESLLESEHEPPREEVEEVRAVYGLRGGDKVRAEMGLRSGEVEDVASGIAPAPPHSVRDNEDRLAKEGYGRPPGGTILVSSRDDSGAVALQESEHEPPREDVEEVRAEYDLRGGDEVWAEMGLRSGEVEDVASGIATAPPHSVRDNEDRLAKEGYDRPPGGTILVFSRNDAGATALPQSLQTAGRRDSAQSLSSDKQSVGGVPGAHTVVFEGDVNRYGHGSLSNVGEGGFHNESGAFVYDQGTPMVVAQAVKAESVRQLDAPVPAPAGLDSFNENDCSPHTVQDAHSQNVQIHQRDLENGGAQGPGGLSGDDERRRSSAGSRRVVGVAIATKDTFKDHLLHSRKTQCGLAALLIAVVGLAVGLGVALTRGGTGSETTVTKSEGFWQENPPAIDGASNQGDFGATVSMNKDGTRVAMGSPGVWDGDSDDGSELLRRGRVEVHVLGSDGKWTALGNPILPSARDANSDILIPNMVVRNLIKVVLSGDGDTVAVGSSFHDRAEDGEKNVGQVEVFRLSDDDEWVPLGDPILGDRSDDFLGASVDLSEDGITLAVGIPGHSSGEDEEGGDGLKNNGAARMFFFNDGKWERLGSGDALGTITNERLGGSVSLSSNGRMLAVGSSTTKEGSNTKVAKVFKFNGYWRELGDGVEGGDGLYDTSYDAKLSADGTKVVVSNHYIGENGPAIQSGVANDDLFVAAFEYNEDEDYWKIMGENLHSSFVGDKSGYFITLSDDGKVIGMGDPGRSINGGRITGHAHIYVYDPNAGEGGMFRQEGPNIDGEAAGDMFGYEVSLSGDGKTFAIGAPSSRSNGFEHGRVQIYHVPQ
mmetsp:Transcript_6245/g.18283  ORF Transcript_6245/g.18283 Transcript_6245/m.18283 type:complete len:957 (-) Transcript_6245:156-3026(-)